MKLPIPTFLYAAAVGLLGFAGWTVYELLPLWQEAVRVAATKKGQDVGSAKLSLGKAALHASADWEYGSSTSQWWAAFREVNLIGKLPPPPPEAVTEAPVPVPVAEPIRPLAEIIEI